MPRVRVLPPVLVDQIAAGEVVERPASVVKELVENALDAGALRVAVEIEGGGIVRTSVTDDGCGMDAGDARLAFERHATSKILVAEDLAAISSLGFRGEALPSIGSVSRLTLTTSPDETGAGTVVEADRGEPPRSTPARSPRGTRVVVLDLFGNVPARRKFLKSPEAEARAVTRVVTSLALSREKVHFSLVSSGRALLDLLAASSKVERLGQVLGPGGEELEPVSFAHLGWSLSGAVTRPPASHASRAWQWLYVGGRGIRDGTAAQAAALAAREAGLGDRHPAWALFLEGPPGEFDVNVHPQKLEVRFRDPSVIHALVHRGLLAALTGGKGATALAGSNLGLRRQAAFPGASFRAPAPAWVADASFRAGGREMEPLLLVEPGDEPSRGAFSSSPVTVSPVGTLRLLGQYRQSFLVAEGEEGIVLVDQHVAHERVRYETILDRLGAEGLGSQRLLVPVRYESSPGEAAAMERAEPFLGGAGFSISSLSGNAFLVTSAPPECAASAVPAVLSDLLARVAELPEGGEGEGAVHRRREVLAASLACRGAVTINTSLSPVEAARLLADLSRCRDPFTCPHGRPILLTLSHGELEKRFGRRM